MEYKCLYAAEPWKSNASYEFAYIDIHGEVIEDEYDQGVREVATSNYIELSKQNKIRWEAVLTIEIITRLLISDARLVFYCGTYNPEGETLIGHIRYEWISGIGFTKKADHIGDTSMQIYYSDSDNNFWVLEMHFTRNTDIERLTNEILKKASGYRLRMSNTKDRKVEEKNFFDEYAKGKQISVGEQSKFSYISFPSHYPAVSGKEFRPGTPEKQKQIEDAEFPPCYMVEDS